MTQTFILIPGRSARQGVTLNEGKYTDGYKTEIATLRMNPQDMQDLQLVDGDIVRVWNEVGEFSAPCTNAKNELPPGMLFIAYGDLSCRVMPADTHGSGMPDSKGLDVFAEKSTDAALQSADDNGAAVPPTEPVTDSKTVSEQAPAAMTDSPQGASTNPTAKPTTPSVSRKVRTLASAPGMSDKPRTPSALTITVMVIIGAAILVFAARAL